MSESSVPERIHKFWFGADVYGAFPIEKVRFWYADPSDPDWLQDQSRQLEFIEEHFLFLVKKACSGGLVPWREEPRHCLALILLLDQFASRLLDNREYGTKCKADALIYCRYGIAHGHDKCLTPVERSFFYTPLLYADKIALRSLGLRLLEGVLEELAYADNPYAHHRNHVLVALHRALAKKTRAEKLLLNVSA